VEVLLITRLAAALVHDRAGVRMGGPEHQSLRGQTQGGLGASAHQARQFRGNADQIAPHQRQALLTVGED